jgi:hypothetical protein
MSNPEIDLNQASQNNSGQRPQTERRPLSVVPGRTISSRAAPDLGSTTFTVAMAAHSVTVPRLLAAIARW